MEQILVPQNKSTILINDNLEKILATKEDESLPMESFKERWEKGIPIEDAKQHLLKVVRELWEK
jgi:hypothetical protein